MAPACWAARAAVVSTLAGIVLALPARPANAAFPGANGRIVFVDRRYNDDGSVTDRLRSVWPDGTGRRILLRTRGYPPLVPGPFLPRWSPNGRRIVLGFRGNVITVDARGRHRRVVAPFDAVAEPSWAPDGRRLLFYRPNARPNALFVMAADSSRPRLILGGLPGNPEIPMWSPAGGRVAFEIYTAGTPTLWTARTDGSGAQALVTGGARPAFSPDGRAIAFALYDRLWIMRAGGGHARPVTAPAPGEVVHGVAFSPDGRFVVIARQRQVGSIGPSRLFVVRRRDGHERMLHVGGTAGSPDWQPLSGR
jgi:Tol biopolymer transport system component